MPRLERPEHAARKYASYRLGRNDAGLIIPRAGAAARTPTRAEAVRRCAATARGGSAELAVERAIHAAASARLASSSAEASARA